MIVIVFDFPPFHVEIVSKILFVCLVNCFLTWLQPLAAYLRNSRERDSNHPCPVSEQARAIPSRVVTFSRNKFL